MDLWRGTLSFRRLNVLLTNLPGDSAYASSLRDSLTPEQMAQLSAARDPNQHGRWSLEAMLAARNGDLLQSLIWQNGDGKSPQPDPYPRPGVAMKQAPVFSDAQRDYLAKARDLRGAHIDG